MDNERCEKLDLLQLPLLTQEKIVENLDEDSKWNLSQTSTFFRDLSREIRGINIHLDLYKTFRKSYLDTLKETPLKCIQFAYENGTNPTSWTQRIVDGVTNLLDYLLSFFSDTWKKIPGKEIHFSQIFPFPLELQTVAFSQKIDARWIFDVLEKCRNLNQLIFNSYVEINGDLNSLLLIVKRNVKGYKLKTKSRCFTLEALCRKEAFLSEIYFSKLNILYIGFRDRNLGDEEFMAVICLIKSLRSEVLNRLFLIVTPKVDLSEMEYFRICWILGEFLEYHNKTLRDISIGVSVKSDQPVGGRAIIAGDDLETIFSNFFNENVQTEPNEIQGQGDSIDEKRKSVKEKVDMMLALREKFQKIAKKSKISYVTLEIPVIFHWDFWYMFIENLHRLCTVRMICSTNFNILKNCTIVRSSYKTLKRLRLDLDLKNPFDCAGLTDCERLEEFYVFYKPSCEQQVVHGPNEPNVLNVNLIPAGLKSLALNNVVVTTKDINKALSKQKNLDTLAIMNMGSFNPQNGTDYNSLKKIFLMRNLQSCLVVQIRCLTKAIHKRTMELLEFQFDFSRMNDIMKICMEGLQAPFALDIVSTECYRRYTWTCHAFAYNLIFNDADPHL